MHKNFLSPLNFLLSSFSFIFSQFMITIRWSKCSINLLLSFHFDFYYFLLFYCRIFFFLFFKKENWQTLINPLFGIENFINQLSIILLIFLFYSFVGCQEKCDNNFFHTKFFFFLIFTRISIFTELKIFSSFIS